MSHLILVKKQATVFWQCCVNGWTQRSGRSFPALMIPCLAASIKKTIIPTLVVLPATAFISTESIGPAAGLGAKPLFPLQCFSRGKSERSWLGITQSGEVHISFYCAFSFLLALLKRNENKRGPRGLRTGPLQHLPALGPKGICWKSWV